jgi:membrane protease YdiL (CAAX protease family)
MAIAGVTGFLLVRVVRLLVPRPQHGPTPEAVLLGEGGLLLAVVFASTIMGRLERRTLGDYGLPLRGAFGPMFWQGALWGFLALTALLFTLHSLHAFSFGPLALHGSALAYDAAVWAVGFLMVGLFEEFLMRGYALFTLSTGVGFWPSAVLLSAVFGALHLNNRGESWIGALGAAMIGLFFCLTLRRTGSLWFAIGFHAMWDYSESFIYSVPDSGAVLPGHLLNSSFHGPVWLTGGTVGPEGSWLVFVVLAALFVIFDRLHREARFALPPRRQ